MVSSLKKAFFPAPPTPATYSAEHNGHRLKVSGADVSGWLAQQPDVALHWNMNGEFSSDQALASLQYAIGAAERRENTKGVSGIILRSVTPPGDLIGMKKMSGLASSGAVRLHMSIAPDDLMNYIRRTRPKMAEKLTVKTNTERSSGPEPF